MRRSLASLILGLGVLVLAPAAHAGSTSAAETLREQASSKRQQAETIRSDHAESGTSGSARAKVRQLEAAADALDRRADKADPPGWPPR